MGAVFVARHRDLGCLRAVKVIEASDPKRVARFEREVTALARVRHPSVVRVHDTGRHGSILYFAMDLIDKGRPLDALLSTLTLEQVLSIVEGAARGVHALHEAGLVHRDVKPANIVVDAHFVPTVIDLGLVASDEFDRLTKTGTMLGTLQYMAPEQALTSDPPDPRNDIYALGAILYEAATGSPPIEAASTQELMMALASRAIEPPSRRRPELPRALDAICRRALARDPDDRYPTALDLAEDLRRLRGGEEPVASAELFRARPRRKLGIAVLAVALVASVALVVERRIDRARSIEACAESARGLHAFLREPWSVAQARAAVREKEALETAEKAQAVGEAASCREAALAAIALAARRRDAASVRGLAGKYVPALDAEPAVAGAIAALGTDAALAEKLLSRAIEAEPDRGDLVLWRAVARARQNEKAEALKDQEKALALRYDDAFDSLVLLALLGDPEAARRAISGRPEVKDPAFARPFAEKAIALARSKGRWKEAVEATRTALLYAPAGSPELVPVARAALDELTLELRAVFEDVMVTADQAAPRVLEGATLSDCATLAAPDERSPELGKVIVTWAALRQDGSDLRLACYEMAVKADPSSFEAWIGLAHTRRFQSHIENRARTREALDRAKALVATPREEVEYLLEAAEQQERNEHDRSGAVATATAAFHKLTDAHADEMNLRGQIVTDLAKWCTELERWDEGLAWADVAEKDRQVAQVALYRSRCHEGLGDLDHAIQDITMMLKDGLFLQYERVQHAAHAEELMRKAGKSLDEIDGMWALIGHAEWDEPRRVALHRAAIALEAGQRDKAGAFLDDAARERGDSVSIKAIRAQLDKGASADALCPGILSLAAQATQ